MRLSHSCKWTLARDPRGYQAPSELMALESVTGHCVFRPRRPRRRNGGRGHQISALGREDAVMTVSAVLRLTTKIPVFLGGQQDKDVYDLIDRENYATAAA